ncbi:MAG: ABC transporter ATP-binding protein, partial [Spirochaetia bacterium]
VPCEQRKVGMVFQNAALFPHLNLEKNVMFGLKGPGRAQRARARQFLEQVGLAELRKAYPHELSGGQQQRVALARALALEPDLILLDEPFSNLDIRIKTKVIEQVRAILTQVDTTALLVTHDINEAYHLADRIGVMRAGSLIQQGDPADLYHSPADSYVADFLGTANEFELEKLQAIFPTLSAHPYGAVDTPESGAQIILRPEDIEIVPLSQANPTSGQSAEGKIEGVTFLGSRREYLVQVASVKMRVSTASHYKIPKGSWVQLTLKPEVHQHLLRQVV